MDITAYDNKILEVVELNIRLRTILICKDGKVNIWVFVKNGQHVVDDRSQYIKTCSTLDKDGVGYYRK